MINETENKQEKLKATIMFVDDEKNILSSLNRLFRPIIDNIITAESGAEALEILNTVTVDIVVSDMRMPEMDGAEFLGVVAEKWPEAIRILLTGYADITSTINAINKGNIYRYISKPWEDNDIIISVRQALEQKFLKEERDRLLKLTSTQNEELKDLTTHLEEKVKARTEEVHQTMDQLEVTYESLKNNYETTIKVFSSIIDLREGKKSSDNTGATDLVSKLAKIAGQSEDQIEQIYFAFLLRNIGRIGFTDDLNHKSFNNLDNDELNIVKQHPVIGQGILMSLDYLHDAANIIRSQHERYDGQGYPDALYDEDIPLGSRIIRLVSDYYGYQEGALTTKPLSIPDTRERIKRKRGMRYDPKLVDLFLEILDLNDSIENEKNNVQEATIQSSELKPDMTLSRNLEIANGVVLLNKGQVLNTQLIRAIHKMEITMKEKMNVHVLIKNGDV